MVAHRAHEDHRGIRGRPDPRRGDPGGGRPGRDRIRPPLARDSGRTRRRTRAGASPLDVRHRHGQGRRRADRGTARVSFVKERPDTPVRTLIFGDGGAGLITYLIIEYRRRVELISIVWYGSP
ncbi:hypothetical protein FDA94_03150 [Herbidospora galbida]|uniref:Uncharacterized protein n=1 Tax=Herbidospora galbida TaxID=2575442 RepID=A0A4U3MR17_9ACTN|nr:hypothetical protein FDA94_03150 [Herbidospora galbida]